MAGKNIALKAFEEKRAEKYDKGLMMPLHWYRNRNSSPLFKIKQKAARAILGLGATAYGLSKLTEASEPKPVGKS